MNPKFRMPLFNQDGDVGGGGSESVENAAPIVETPAPTNQPSKPLMDYNPLLFAPNETPTPQAPVALEELDFAGRKVQVVDPVIRDIHKDYSTLQKTYQETNLTMKTLQEQNQAYQRQVEAYQQQGTQTQEPVVETPAGPSSEDNETFMNQFYDSPLATFDQRIEAMVNARLEAALKPMQQEREQSQREQQVSLEVQSLTEKYGDFQDHVETMQEILRTNPTLADQGLEMVYFAARGQQTRQQAPTPTPEQLLTDPAFRTQLMNDEKFRNEIISSYMQNRSNTNQQVPPIMGNQPGGNSPAIPESRPTTIREASNIFKRSLGF